MGHRQPLMEAVSRRVLNVAQGSPADLAALLEERGAAGDERASLDGRSCTIPGAGRNFLASNA
jgi:hypothetical protein